ncbi:hypothetical protein BD289DRAFT_443140 [Coniella lustricola]|uniref:Uncharacterized protein n=1 Tax=Coniella lustricola TaxID=2025994 RepID=A0A2T2ZXE2_9PEZI|nr:hypothetical protein BD289DRAFT_443140 [Coniella lustricola]
MNGFYSCFFFFVLGMVRFLWMMAGRPLPMWEMSMSCPFYYITSTWLLLSIVVAVRCIWNRGKLIPPLTLHTSNTSTISNSRAVYLTVRGEA